MKRRTVVIIAVAIIGAVAFLLLPSRPLTISALAPPIPYVESKYTNVHRGAEALCSAIEVANKSSTQTDWKQLVDLAKARKLPSDKLRAEDLIRKIHNWVDGTTGVRGRDRVLCVGTNQDPNVDRIALEYFKWVNQCDRALIFSSKAAIGRDVPAGIVVEIHPFGGDEPTNAWQRLRTMIKHIVNSYQHFDSVDYVVFFGDDTFMSVPNLKKMLREPYYAEMDRLGVPMLLGHRMVSGGNDVFVSSSGFIMNKVVLRILASLLNSGLCDPTLVTPADDLPLAQCLAKVGIFALDTYDEFDEDRMTPFNPWQLADLVNDPNSSPWYRDYRHPRAMPKGVSALSAFPVSLHYMDLKQMDDMNQAVMANTKKLTSA